MKNIDKSIWFLLLLFLGVSACDLEVIPDVDDLGLACDSAADFEVDKTTCDFPCEVTITNTSSSFAQTFFWDFGDGDTLQANDAEPLKHTFAEPGNYTISLQVECADGELSSVAAKTVSVIDPTAPPTCIFSIVNNGCYAPCTVELDNQSEDAPEVQWYLDGELISEEHSPELFFDREMVNVPLMLKVINGEKRDSCTEFLNVRIHRFSDTDPFLGSGKAIFQLADQGLLMAGNTGASGGDIFLLRLDAEGDPVGNFPLTFSFNQPVTVEDAIRLSDGTFALIGHADNDPSDDKFRIIYFHFDANGGILHGPTFLQESLASLNNRDIFAVGLAEMSNGNLIVVGTSQDGSDQDIYFKVIGPDLTPNSQPVLFSGSGSNSYFAGDVEAVGANVFISGSEFNGSGFESFLLATDKFGTPLSGFPKPGGNNLQSIQSMAFAAGSSTLYMSGVNDGGGVYLGKISSSGAGSFQLLSNLLSSGFPKSLTLSADEDMLVLSGYKDNDAILAPLSLQGQLLIVPAPTYGGNGNDGFNAGIATSDGGFACCGFQQSATTLFYLKSDQIGDTTP